MSDDPMDIQNLAKAASEQFKEILSQDIIVQQQARIEELEANINIKADFIDATINQLEAAEQRGYANAMEAERKIHEDRIKKLKTERDAALVALFECMEEIDAYIQQEYPQDHPVHERYRQRDYAANPARIFLRDRPDALVKARAMLAEADLARQTATMKGQNDE